MVTWSPVLHVDPKQPGVHRVSLHGQVGGRKFHIGLIVPMATDPRVHDRAVQAIRLICDQLEQLAAIGGQEWDGGDLLTFPDAEPEA